MAVHTPGYPLHFHQLASAVGADDTAVQYSQSSLTQPPAFYQLPPCREDFTGRSAELKTVTDLVEQVSERPDRPFILAIVGRAGVGKSTLAIELAHRLKSTISDVQLYVNLRGADNQPLPPTEVLAGLLRIWHTNGRDIPTDLAEQQQRLQRHVANRRLLLVLDNADDEEQVRPLIPYHLACTVVITSRKRLTTLEDAQVLDLAELPESEALQLFETVGGKFIASDREVARSIVHEAGRSPLAIALVGSVVKIELSLTLAEWATKLAAARTQVEQLQLSHPEIRASFKLTYDHLPPAHARLLRLLGVLTDATVTPTIAAMLLETEVALAAAALDQLAVLNLLKSTGPERYQLTHDLVRLLARGQLAIEESAEARRAARLRLCQGYLALAESMALGLNSPGAYRLVHAFGNPENASRTIAEQSIFASMNWFETERLNLLAAIEWADQAEMWEMVIRFTERLVNFFDQRAYWAEWQRTHTLAANAAKQLGDRAATARVLNNLGNLHLRQCNWETAKDCYEQSLDIFQEIHDSLSASQTLVNLGILYYQQGDQETTATLWKTALAELTADSAEQQAMLQWMQAIDPQLLPIQPQSPKNSEPAEARRSGSHGFFQAIGGVIKRLIPE